MVKLIKGIFYKIIQGKNYLVFFLSYSGFNKKVKRSKGERNEKKKKKTKKTN